MKKSKTDYEQEGRVKLRKIHPTEQHMLDALMTVMGCAAEMLIFIHEFRHLFQKIPLNVKYAMSLTAAQMYTYTSADPDVQHETVKFPLMENLSKEQEEETMRQKLKQIVEILYTSMKEEDQF